MSALAGVPVGCTQGWPCRVRARVCLWAACKGVPVGCMQGCACGLHARVRLWGACKVAPVGCMQGCACGVHARVRLWGACQGMCLLVLALVLLACGWPSACTACPWVWHSAAYVAALSLGGLVMHVVHVPGRNQGGGFVRQTSFRMTGADSP